MLGSLVLLKKHALFFRRTRCAAKVLKWFFLLACVLSIVPAAYLLLPFIGLKAMKSEFECYNQHEENVTATIQEFNSQLSKRLLEKDIGKKLVYQDNDSWVQLWPGAYVYAAYMDKTNTSDWQIRIISIVSRHATPENSVQCWLSVGSAVFLSRATLKVLPEHHDRPFGAAFFLCPVKFRSEMNDQETIRVALGTDWNMTSPKWLNVHQRQRTPPIFCSVCVRPIVGLSDKMSLIAEFIAYYSSMGIGSFNLYLCEVPRDVELLLLHFKDTTKVNIQLYRWNLHMNKSTIHEYGQLAALQDCFYRSRLTSEYVVSVDFDEFLVPKTRETLTEALLEIETSVGKKSLGSILIKNRFFCYEYPAYTAFLTQKPPLLTRILFIHEVGVWKYRERSKYVARPTAVVVSGVHFVWQHLRGTREVAISEAVMVLQHYRACCNVTKMNFWGSRDDEFLTEERVVADTSIHRHLKKMIHSDVIGSLKLLVEEPLKELPSYTDD
ncbi:uncharacterized protein LOC144174153 isoform X2 [Haemaphysalis longicornis]